MPGVPSGRGCDACRKQKKKCDGQQPTCSRCLRLGLKCHGSGQRRFKFIQIQDQAASRKSKSPENGQQQEIIKLSKPSPIPTNEATKLVSSFVSGLGVKDLRFSLSCYGVFLPEIPKRLGTHPALDASASALICAYPTVYRREPSYEALEKYGRAMQALRVTLESPEHQSRIIEVLCAIYFLMICQTWIWRPGEQSLSHGKAVAHVLNSVAGKFSMESIGEGFEQHVLNTMCVVVVIEAIFDPTVKLHPWYRENVVSNSGFGKPRKDDETMSEGIATCERPPSDGLAQNSITIESLARIPELVHSPRTNYLEIQMLYLRACLDSEEVVQRQATFAETISALDSTSTPPAKLALAEKMIPLCQIARGMLLSIAIVCNAILAALDPTDFSLATDCARFCDDAIALAHEVSCYRPLGASHVPLSLIGAYMTVADPEKQKVIHRLLLEYGSDFPSADWLQLAVNARKKYEESRRDMWDSYRPGRYDIVDVEQDESLCHVQ
ncbi:hypothetical protein Q7P37_008669 [Cladosporium fusiforme]